MTSDTRTEPSDESVQSPGPERYRTLSGAPRVLQQIVLGALPILGLAFILGLHTRLGVRIYTEQWVGLFLTLFLVGVFLTLPASRGGSHASLPWYDGILAALAVPAGLYLTILYPQLVNNLGATSSERVLAAGLATLLILEAVRRIAGWLLVGVVVTFLVYGAYGSYLAGTLSAQPTTWPRYLNYLYLDPNSLLWMLGLAATIGVGFITFGQVLLQFGAGQALTSFALRAFGRYRGGAAKTAVVGSSLVGTVTGAPMSNVFLTGTVTIPMMIRSGYRRPMAAGIEAVASTGGQIMPPVMGIAAFIIADRLGVEYAAVALAALIPAILYFLALFIEIDATAAAGHVAPAPEEERESTQKPLHRLLVIVPPVAIVVWGLFVAGMEASRAAALAAIGALPFLLLVKANRQNFGRKLVEALVGSGRLILEVATVLAAAGLVIGVTSVSGLGFNLSFELVSIGDQSLVALLLVTAVGSIVLGMGMPSVAAYALVAVLFAPALTQFGVEPLAAHLFIYFFAVASNITPPIAIAAFAAAPLAGTSAFRSALASMKLGVVIYVVPFAFVFHPELLLDGDLTLRSIGIISISAIGVALMAAALGRYLVRPLTITGSVVLLAVGLALALPLTPTTTASIVGVGLAVVVARAAVLRARGVPLRTCLTPFEKSPQLGGVTA